MSQSTIVEPTQEQLQSFVSREVIQCASMLITEMSTQEKYMHDLMDVMSQPDYVSPAEYHIYSDMNSDELAECLEEYEVEYFQVDSTLVMSKKLVEHIQKNQLHVEFCERENLSYDNTEALEHWFVTDWLADKLEDQGEMVIKDFHGLTIWGRTCSGQAILLDGVIASIWKSIQ